MNRNLLRAKMLESGVDVKTICEQEARIKTLEATGRLNDRQIRGARWLLEGKPGQVTVDAWKKKFRTATETARQDLLLLCEEGLLERKLEGRKAVFTIRHEE